MDRRAGIAIGLLLLGVAYPFPHPYASAQGPGVIQTTLAVDIQEPNGPPLGIMIPGRPYALEVKVHYQYGQGAVQPTGPTRVDLELLGAADWMQAHLNATTLTFAINATSAVGGSTVTNVTYIRANLTLVAPAYALGNVTVAARAQANGNLAASEAQDTQAFRPGFIPQMTASPGTETVVAKGGIPARVPIRFENQGNGPLLVNLTLVLAPQGARVQIPEAFVLSSQATGGEGRETREVVVLTPWTSSPRGAVEIRAEFTHDVRHEIAGEPQTILFDVAGESPVPGFEGAGTLGILAGIAVIRFRGRESNPKASYRER